MIYLPVNVNDTIRIKLTPHGRKILKDHEIELNRAVNRNRAVIESKDGWSTWQLWEVMQIFGSYLYSGCEVPFNTQMEWTVGESNDKIG